jgi:hypothetical protein
MVSVWFADSSPVADTVTRAEERAAVLRKKKVARVLPAVIVTVVAEVVQAASL